MDPLLLTYGSSAVHVAPAGDPLGDCQTQFSNMRTIASLADQRAEDEQSKARLVASATGVAGLVAGYLIGKVM